MRITFDELEERGARCGSLWVFKEEWPEGADVTLENIERAVELNLDMRWFISAFFPSFYWYYRERAAPIEKVYTKRAFPIWKEYRDEMTALWQELKDRIATLEGEGVSDEGLAPPWWEYRKKAHAVRQRSEEKVKPFRQEYKKRMATMIFNLIKKML